MRLEGLEREHRTMARKVRMHGSPMQSRPTVVESVGLTSCKWKVICWA